MSGLELCGGHRGYGGHARDERNGAVILDRGVRRAVALLVTLTALLTLVQVTAAQAEPMPAGIPGTWALKINEEFTSNGLNTALWTPGWQSDASITGPISGECEASKNVSQPGNGYIYLEVRKEHATCGTTTVENTGGVIESNPSDGQPGHSGYSYTYGVVEWEAYSPGVAPTGRGCPKGGCLPDWPALWSLSSTNADEIDTMEGLETLGQACFHIHPPPGAEGPGACLSGSYAGWHKFASEWEPGVVKFFYDGAQVGELSSGVLNGTPQYLIADMVPPGCCNQPLVVPDEMVVNYVRVWQHPAPPTVTTTAASAVEEEEATLNGSVNGNGVSTTYHFEYGGTTAYGASTPAVEGGSGSSSPSATITGLAAGTTYHYRLVATSSGGTTDGGDQTFKTASRPAPVLQTNGEKDVFYNGSNNTIWDWGFHSPTWTDYDPGGSPVGSPSSVVGKGFIDTFYRGTNGAIWDLEWNGSEFIDYDLGGSPAGDPSAVALSGGGDDAFYRGTNGAIWGFIYNGSGWTNTELGGSATGTPSVVQGSVSTDVYYRGTDGTLYDWEYGTKWTDLHLGGTPAGNPAALALKGGGEDALYRGTNGAIWGFFWNGTGWTNSELGGSATGTPSVVQGSVSTDIYYRGTDGTLYDWELGTKWTDVHLGGALAGSPAALVTSTGAEDAYYQSTSGAIWGFIWNGTGWTNTELGLDPPVVATQSAAAQETQATLKGTVNPNSKDTHYYFEYGETSSYGHSTPAPPGTDAGAGTSEVAASATATGLESDGTIYHYRIVAQNAGGTTDGSDQTFQTAAKPAPVLQTNGEKDVFYHGSNNTIWDWGFHSPTWTDYDPGGSPVGSPSSVVGKGFIDTFYRGTNGTIWDLEWNGSEFTEYDLGGTPAGDPSAVALSGGGDDAFYRGTNGAIWGFIWNGSGWTNTELGGSATGTPSVVQGSVSTDVYYRGTDGTLYDWEYGTKWTDLHLGGTPAGNPAALALKGGGEDAFYTGTNGAIWGFIWNGSGWTNTELGGSATGTASAVQGSASTDVYYRGTDGTLYDWEYGTKWTDLHLGGSPGGSPAALVTASGGEDAYYQGTNGAIWGEIWNGTGWTNTEL